MTSALTIEHGLKLNLYAVALTTEQRRAILGVLADCPDGLSELRGHLLSEHGRG